MSEKWEFEQARRMRRAAIKTDADRISYEREFLGHSWFDSNRDNINDAPGRKGPQRDNTPEQVRTRTVGNHG